MALRINRLTQSLGDLCANESAGKAKISRTSLAYYHFAYANEQETETGSKSENQQDKSYLLPFCVRK